MTFAMSSLAKCDLQIYIFMVGIVNETCFHSLTGVEVWRVVQADSVWVTGGTLPCASCRSLLLPGGWQHLCHRTSRWKQWHPTRYNLSAMSLTSLWALACKFCSLNWLLVSDLAYRKLYPMMRHWDQDIVAMEVMFLSIQWHLLHFIKYLKLF